MGGGGGEMHEMIDSGAMEPVDSGTVVVDAGPGVMVDAGKPVVDAGQPVVDAGKPIVDAGQPTVDAGTFPSFRTCTPPGTRRVLNGGLVGPATAPSGCQKPVQPSALQGVQKISFGTHKVNDVLTFNVPPSVGGLCIVQQAVSATSTVSVQGQTTPNASIPNLLKTPGGLVLFDDNNPNPPTEGPSTYIWFQAPSEVTGVVTIPATTKALSLLTGGSLPSGTWSVTVNDYAAECAGGSASLCTGGATTANTYDVSVLLRRGPVPSTGTVDLAFYLVSSSLTATTALTDANFKRMLDTLATIYGRAGLCLGDVTLYDVPAWAKAKYATGVDATATGACDGLDQMFTLSKPGDNTLNFFMVDDIAQAGSGSGGTIVGIDGAIPGPSSVGGTVKSGAVVNISDLSFTGLCTSAINPAKCGPDQVAYITAHEGGHWLGLYHTTESSGGAWDPLDDSPKCTCNTTCLSTTAAANCCDPATNKYPDGTPCTGAVTSMSGSVCNSTTKPSCQGADSLMFWVIDQTSVGIFSAQQAAVMRANPVVQ